MCLGPRRYPGILKEVFQTLNRSSAHEQAVTQERRQARVSDLLVDNRNVVVDPVEHDALQHGIE